MSGQGAEGRSLSSSDAPSLKPHGTRPRARQLPMSLPDTATVTLTGKQGAEDLGGHSAKPIRSVMTHF